MLGERGRYEIAGVLHPVTDFLATDIARGWDAVFPSVTGEILYGCDVVKRIRQSTILLVRAIIDGQQLFSLKEWLFSNLE